MKWFFKKWLFVIGCLFRGMPLSSAKWRWHLQCLESATKDCTGQGMGNYKVVLPDGHIMPNRKD